MRTDGARAWVRSAGFVDWLSGTGLQMPAITPVPYVFAPLRIVLSGRRWGRFVRRATTSNRPHLTPHSSPPCAVPAAPVLPTKGVHRPWLFPIALRPSPPPP